MIEAPKLYGEVQLGVFWGEAGYNGGAEHASCGGLVIITPGVKPGYHVQLQFARGRTAAYVQGVELGEAYLQVVYAKKQLRELCLQLRGREIYRKFVFVVWGEV